MLKYIKVLVLKQLIIDILIIIFMQKLSDSQKSHDDTYSQLPEMPSTPKKKPKYLNLQQPSSRRIKSITKMTQKQSASLIYSLLVLIWVVVVAFVLYMAFQTKLKGAESTAQRDIQTCRLEFQNNRCQSPVPGLKVYCSQKLACMQENSYERSTKTVSYSRIFGEMASQFAQGAGLLGILVGIGLIGMCVRQKGKEKQIVSVQFFDD